MIVFLFFMPFAMHVFALFVCPLCLLWCVCVSFCFTHSYGDRITLSVLGNLERYEVENEMEFTSERKRMSVIVRDLSNGR